MLSQTLYVAMGEEPVCVTHLCRCGESEVFTAALSNQEMKSYAWNEGSCGHVSTLRGTEGKVTDQRFHGEGECSCLLTCTERGALEEWDLRTGASVLQFRHKMGFTCLDATEHVAAVGTEQGTVCFIDLRKRALMTEFEDTHASSLTHIAFHPVQRDALFSASEDGMLSVFDLSLGLDEDASFIVASISVMKSVKCLCVQAGQNWDAISHFGFFGGEEELLWCLTAQHGLILWEWKAAALDLTSERGSVPYYQVPDMRPQLSTHSAEEIAYCLSCFSLNQELKLIGGNDTGTLGMFSIPAFHDSDKKTDEVICDSLMKGGHGDSVECFLPWDDSTWLTGGEDSRICIWRDLPPEKPHISTEKTRSHVIVQNPRQNRMAPY